MRNKNFYSSFSVLNTLLFIYFIELIFPPITVVASSTLVCALCLAGWLIISFMSNSSFYLELNIHRSFLLIFFGVSIVFPYLIGYSTFGNRYLALALIPLGVLIFDYYKCHGKLGDLKKIILLVMAFAGITFFITLERLIENPYISRSIKSSGEYSRELARQGIGGYSFIYFTVVMGVILLYIFFKTRRKAFKWLSMIGYCLIFYFIFRSNYVTALLVFIIASAVLIFVNFSQRDTKNRIILFICIIAGMLILLNLNSIVIAIEDYLPKRVAKALVPENEESVLKTVFEEFINDRWPRMYVSIKSFLSSPVLGLMGDSNTSYDSFLSGFGQHSHMLDTFAIYGGLMGVVNLFVVFAPFKDMDGVWIKSSRSLTAGVVVCMIGIYFFNNATSAIALAIGIVYPLVRENYIDNEDYIENEDYMEEQA